MEAAAEAEFEPEAEAEAEVEVDSVCCVSVCLCPGGDCHRSSSSRFMRLAQRRHPTTWSIMRPSVVLDYLRSQALL